MSTLTHTSPLTLAQDISRTLKTLEAAAQTATVAIQRHVRALDRAGEGKLAGRLEEVLYDAVGPAERLAAALREYIESVPLNAPVEALEHAA